MPDNAGNLMEEECNFVIEVKPKAHPVVVTCPDAVAETVARLKWWGAGGFIVGRRVVTNIYELAAADSGCSPPPRKKRKRGGFTAKALASQGAGDGGGGTGGESASGSSIAARLLA